MDALEALCQRRSVRIFEDRPVPDEWIERIVDCGRLASTALNRQPWEFVIVTDHEMRRQLAAATGHGRHIADAPVCILVFCENTEFYLEDGCAATQNLLVAAWALGLGSCWVSGDKNEYAHKIRNMVGVPDSHRLVSLIPVGYAGFTPSPPKRPLEEVIHWEAYQERSSQPQEVSG